MDIQTYLLVFAAYLGAAFLKGVTGLGFSTICLALLANIIGLKEGLPLVIIPSVASNILVMLGAGHFRESAARFWPMYLSVIPGIALGLFLLTYISDVSAGGALGLVLTLYSLIAFWGPRAGLSGKWEKPLTAPVGFLTGMVNGVTGTQVIPMLPFLLSLGLDKNRVVQAVNISFTLSSLVMFAGLIRIDLLGVEELYISALGLIPALLGVTLGSRLRQRLSEEMFRRLVLFLLLGLGLNLAAGLVF